MPKLKSISPSRIKTWQMCRFKYWMTYHEPEIELKTNWGAQHGSLVHDILKSIAEDPRCDWVTMLYQGYAGRLKTVDNFGKSSIMTSPLKWAKASDFRDVKPYCDICPFKRKDSCQISEEPLDNLSGCAKFLFEKSVYMIQDVLKRYKNILLDNPKCIKGIEQKFQIPIKNTGVNGYGFLDLSVELDKDTIEIIDYKTGKYTQSYAECLNDIQVKMYSWAARKIYSEDVLNLGYNYRNVILTFDYFTSTPITLAFSARQDNETELEIAKVIEQIESADQIFRRTNNPSRDFRCKNLCDVDQCVKHWRGNFDAPAN